MSTGRSSSVDGTLIAFDRFGEGDPVIVVGGALQGRATYQPLAQELARHFTVLNYDRRGRGDSGDTPPYAVDREVEDLAALVTEAGGRASLYGHSSGAVLALHAAARGLPLHRIVLHDPTFGSGTAAEQQTEREEAEHLTRLLAQGRRTEALTFFFTSMGLPPEAAETMSQDPAMQANAPTLVYDPYTVLSAESRDGRTPEEQAREITIPALVVTGDANPGWMIDASRRIAEALPQGRLTVLTGQEHVVPPEILVPILAGFLNGETSS
jgi:pimeloyl-ACP methyl ester carboxylesterase